MRPRPQPIALALACAFALGGAGAGCTLNRPESQPGSLLGRVGGGQPTVEPKRCLVKVWVLPMPLGDPTVNEAVWGRADEQIVATEVRRQLEANGLRVGVLTGGLPAAVEGALNAPPPHRIEPTTFDLPDGFNTLVNVAAQAPSVSLILNRDGRTLGKDYKDASGYLRVTASQEGPTAVALRLVPEIHHGPIQRRYDNAPGNGGKFNTLQFMQKDGQQEETLRELATTLTLQPGQKLVIGHDPERKGSLGSVLLTQPEPNSDRLLQKVVILEVARTNPGLPGSQAKIPADLRPVDPFETGPGPTPPEVATRPAAPAGPSPRPTTTDKGH